MGGKGRLSIRTRRAAPSSNDFSAPVGDYVCITVSDTGEGMTPDVLAKAFDPFFTTKPIGQGTGLGLSMIYGFVQQSRGHIVIDSEVGRGTAVSLYLPVHYGAIAEVGARSLSATPIGASEQVLVVEDDPSVRLLVLDVLKELNYVGVEAGDGPAALHILDTDRPIQLLITDVGLPGLNGRQVAEIARQRRPNLPVLFMTGYSLEPMKRDALLDAGMDIISKPFSMEALARAIQKILVSPGF
jgi:CheY-like chemotaxis protein